MATKVRLASGAGGTFGVDDIAVAWALTGGFWKAEGLDIEVIGVRGGVRAVDHVLNGEADVGYGTFMPCVRRRLEGKPVKIVASMALALAQNLIVNKNRISQASDLRGKKWCVDGIGALSHTLSQLIVDGLGIPDNEMNWDVGGPPPQRIDKLLKGDVDCALVRVEEAAVLIRENPDLLNRLMTCCDVHPLAPVQPHGVLSVTEAYANENPEICAALMRGLIRASRSLHESLDDFRQAVRDNVTERPEALGPRVDVSDDEVQSIWQREHDAGSFAVNGGVNLEHWAWNMQMYGKLNSGDGASLSFEDLALPRLAVDVLENIGIHPGAQDIPDLAANDRIGAPMVENAPVHLCCH